MPSLCMYCAICGCGSGCLAGNGDDDFCYATKEKVIRNLEEKTYPDYRLLMLHYLNKRFNDIPQQFIDEYKQTVENGFTVDWSGRTVKGNAPIKISITKHERTKEYI